MKQPAAVLGVGQTRHRSKRTDVSIAGLCREAADRALADAGLELADIDPVRHLYPVPQAAHPTGARGDLAGHGM